MTGANEPNEVHEAGGLPQLDTHNDVFMANPGKEIAAQCPGSSVVQGKHGKEFLSYQSVADLYHDRQFRPPDRNYFAGQGASPIVHEFVDQGLLLMMPEESHARVRRILLKGFAPRRIESWRPTMQELATVLVDRANPERMEFVEEFAFHYSIGVIARFIGVPVEDITEFCDATVTLRLIGERPLAPHLAELERGLETVRNYVSALIERRRRQPREDFISDVLALQKSEGSLSDSEVVWGIGNLLLAGHDTTRYQLASVVRAVIEAGEWEHLAKEPDLLAAAVNEGIRLYPVTFRNTRVAAGSAKFGGQSFEPGELAILNVGAAGRDPARFPDPDSFDLARDNWDIGFGRGPHLCLGHALAMAEMVEALRILTQRLTDVAIDGPVRLGNSQGPLLFCETLPLRYRLR